MFVCILLLLLYTCTVVVSPDNEPLATSCPTSMLVILVSLNPIASNYLFTECFVCASILY